MTRSCASRNNLALNAQRMLLRVTVLAAFVLGIALSAWSHGGGLDAQGGHNDRKNGGYHFHRGSLAGRSFADKASALKALRGETKTSGESASKPGNKAGRTNVASEEQTTHQSAAVYVTRTGKKYHRAGCQYLRSSQRKIDLSEAMDGGYTACSRCSPPKP